MVSSSATKSRTRTPLAHGVVAALLKRLTHRNPTVALSFELHWELASRAWTAGLVRVITDRVSGAYPTYVWVGSVEFRDGVRDADGGGRAASAMRGCG
ncbi:hypothetical protein B0H11DRAFT_2306254 [Mycena galericulata]|nr:hypothetical protein B0H11DRAFT_2306254 [Mycena galericulata]